MFNIRQYQQQDGQALCDIFISSIKEVASRDYSLSQITAWAQVDDERWQKKLATSWCRVAVMNAKPVGFITVIGTYIDLLFVAPECIRQGVARALLAELFIQMPGCKFSVDASITARPLFEHAGFQVIRQQCVETRGERFINFHMVRQGA